MWKDVWNVQEEHAADGGMVSTVVVRWGMAAGSAGSNLGGEGETKENGMEH